MIRCIILLSGLLCIGYNSTGQKAHLNLDKSDKAIQGYDPVSYFSENRAEKGSKHFQSESGGATYWFKNQENKNLFQNNQTKYTPIYGGWCAYAMGINGDKVKIDPDSFKIIDGKLYLFYNFYFTNTLEKWNEDEASFKKIADLNWSKIVGP
ncbi:MAG: YHS domain-containing protein [Cyclobacteriaceae bacterium]|jgi:YHS domain-containing protein